MGQYVAKSILLQLFDLNPVYCWLKTVFCKTANPKLKLCLCSSSDFCFRQILRRDLPANATFSHCKFASLNLLGNQRYSKASCISARNESWLYCDLSHVQLLTLIASMQRPFLQYTTSDYYKNHRYQTG